MAEPKMVFREGEPQIRLSWTGGWGSPLADMMYWFCEQAEKRGLKFELPSTSSEYAYIKLGKEYTQKKDRIHP